MITLTFYRYVPQDLPEILERKYIELMHDQFGKDIKITCIQYRRIIHDTISMDNEIDGEGHIQDFLDKHFGLVETIDSSNGNKSQKHNVPDYFQKFLSDGVLIQFVE
jgi:hypothetical protein